MIHFPGLFTRDIQDRWNGQGVDDQSPAEIGKIEFFPVMCAEIFLFAGRPFVQHLTKLLQQQLFIIACETFGWSDLGTWNSAWDNMEKDYFGNAVVGNHVMVVDANNCMVHVPNNKLVLLQGLKDYIIVDTKDVLLICKRNMEQEIKDYVAEVKRNKGDKFL